MTSDVARDQMAGTLFTHKPAGADKKVPPKPLEQQPEITRFGK
jgi:hypothetical protein